MPFPLQHRDGRIRYGKGLIAAVRLLDRDLQVAAVARGIEVVNGEGARRHRAVVNLIAVLLYRDLRGTARYTVNNRREAFLAVRQHVVIGSQLRAAEVNPVKDIAVGIAITQRQPRA